jgi:PAS domain S-box-containing protein
MPERITLGLQIDQLVSGYARLLIAGISDWSRVNDVNLIVFSGRVLATPRGHEYQSNVIFDYIEKGSIDALVMATGTQCTYLSPEQLGAYMRRFSAIPAVSLGVRVEGVPSIVIDNRDGILEAMDHLVVTHGFRRIAFLNGPERNQESGLRFEAYREALRIHGLEDDPDLSLPGDFTQAGARASMTAYLDRHPAHGFEALLAANDEMAIAAAQVLVQRGYSIPKEIAVIGFDNIQNSQFTVPSLTTIEQRLYDQGWTAAEIAAKLAKGGSVPPTITLPTRLVIRTSCGCLPRSVVELDSATAGRKPAAKGSGDTGMIVEECLARLARLDLALAEPSLRRILTLLVGHAGSDEFLSDFNDALRDELTRGIDISPWQSLLTILQGELIQAARPAGEGKLLETRIQKARVLLSEMLRLEQGKGWTELQGQLSSLRVVMERLVSVASMEELMADLADELHRIDVRTCFIACYSAEVRHRRTDTWVIPERAEIALACVDGIRLFPGETEHVFSPGARFVPSRYLPQSRRYTLIATATYFREDQIGYVVFEPGQRDNAIYETFCVQLSNLLQGSILFRARQKVVEVRARERALMAVLMDTIPDRIYFKDSESRFVLINKALAAVLGVSDPAQAIGRTDFDFYTAEHAQGTFDVEQAIVRSGQPIFDLEEMETWPDGRVIWVSTTKMPLRDETGVVVGTFGISKDITERRHAQSQIIQAQRLESLGTLAGGIAHQFNNINAIIKGYMDILLESRDLSALSRNYCMEALKRVNRLVDITNRLQGLTVTTQSDETACRLDELTRALMPLFEKRFEETKTNVVLELRGTPAVRAHRSRVEFIITCLVANALDALLDRPVRVVTIRTGTGPDEAYLDVEDTGCGIPPENIPRLFTPFFTTKGEWAVVNSAQAGAKGVGLSLSVCHSTVAEYGGRIEVQSEPGAGSRFRVWLPAVEDQR